MSDPVAAPRAPPQVLVVDDDVSVSRVLIRCLATECDVACTTTTDALGAFKILCDRSFDLLVTDMAMAGMSGIELLRIASERWPKMRRVLFTGYFDSSWVAEHKHYADAVLPKGETIRPICKTICALAFNVRPGGNSGTPEAD